VYNDQLGVDYLHRRYGNRRNRHNRRNRNDSEDQGADDGGEEMPAESDASTFAARVHEDQLGFNYCEQALRSGDGDDSEEMPAESDASAASPVEKIENEVRFLVRNA